MSRRDRTQQVVAEMREREQSYWRGRSCTRHEAAALLRGLSTRLAQAHGRDVAELKRKLKEPQL